MELPVILNAGHDGYIVAECPVIPGCISQGRTRREALRNIREAIELCLESRAEEVPLHPELDRGTLRAILRTVDMNPGEFLALLRK